MAAAQQQTRLANYKENEKEYPDPDMFGVTPSHGFFIRHVRGLEMNGIKIECLEEDARPAFVLEDVHGADFSRINVPRSGDRPVFVLNNVENFSVTGSKSVPDTKLEKVDKGGI